MADIQKGTKGLVRALKEKDVELKGSPSVLGMTALTYPNYVNSMRSTMFTAHLKQYLNLIEPDFPYIFTNNENMVGKYSSGYKKAKNKLKIIKKIVKYEDILEHPNVYVLIVYDEENDMYDIIERKICESLTENFGYDYINDKIDSYNEGDEIDKDTVLIRSTSYDEDMNYSYGANVNVAYTLDPFTSEDAAIASESLAQKMTSIETEEIAIYINNNDYLLNLYGDEKHYQPLPEINQSASYILAASRKMFTNQLLWDFKSSELNNITDADPPFYIEDDSVIIDYDIYENAEERNDNPFYWQINKYMDSQRKYYKEIYKECKKIIDSGANYSQELDYRYARAQKMIDREMKWRNDDSTYGNIEIVVTYRRTVPLAKGSKITGRYGNKSVISLIVPDDKMPYTEDGRRVDLLLNLLAIINRTTAAPLFEIAMNNASFQIRQKMMELKTITAKEKLLFDFIKIFNEDQEEEMHADYRRMDRLQKEAYIKSAIEDGIYIHWNPMWEKIPIFYRYQNLKKTYPFIKPVTTYIRKWGREIKMLNDYIIGEMYILKLKQSDRRGFSARSTGALDITSLPTRSFKKKSHQERISSSCIRFGEQETFNFSIGLPTIDIALFHALYRTSIKGRKDIIKIMFSDDSEDSIQKIDASYTSRVSEIFMNLLKAVGIEVEFVEDDADTLEGLNDIEIHDHVLDNGKRICCTDYQFYLINRVNETKQLILESNPILTDEALTELIREYMLKEDSIVGPTNDQISELDIKELLKAYA